MSFWLFWADSNAEDAKNAIAEIDPIFKLEKWGFTNFKRKDESNNSERSGLFHNGKVKTPQDSLTEFCNFDKYFLQDISINTIAWTLFILGLTISIYFFNAIWVAPFVNPQIEARIRAEMQIEAKKFFEEYLKEKSKKPKTREDDIQNYDYKKQTTKPVIIRYYHNYHKDQLFLLYIFDKFFSKFDLRERILLSALLVIWSVIIPLAIFFGPIYLVKYVAIFVKKVKDFSKTPKNEVFIFLTLLVTIFFLILFTPEFFKEVKGLWQRENFSRYILENILLTIFYTCSVPFLSIFSSLLLVSFLYLIGEKIYKIFKKIKRR